MTKPLPTITVIVLAIVAAVGAGGLSEMARSMGQWPVLLVFVASALICVSITILAIDRFNSRREP